eukprot:GHVS01016155.1.p1 GENE.GHVS01016155.1~~GHVS01016155.1.p1  ORF type:complete len:555 (-),score=127.44 GHVS01016155.1:2639-4303(-)
MGSCCSAIYLCNSSTCFPCPCCGSSSEFDCCGRKQIIEGLTPSSCVSSFSADSCLASQNAKQWPSSFSSPASAIDGTAGASPSSTHQPPPPSRYKLIGLSPSSSTFTIFSSIVLPSVPAEYAESEEALATVAAQCPTYTPPSLDSLVPFVQRFLYRYPTTDKQQPYISPTDDGFGGSSTTSSYSSSRFSSFPPGELLLKTGGNFVLLHFPNKQVNLYHLRIDLAHCSLCLISQATGHSRRISLTEIAAAYYKQSVIRVTTQPPQCSRTLAAVFDAIAATPQQEQFVASSSSAYTTGTTPATMTTTVSSNTTSGSAISYGSCTSGTTVSTATQDVSEVADSAARTTTSSARGDRGKIGGRRGEGVTDAVRASFVAQSDSWPQQQQPNQEAAGGPLLPPSASSSGSSSRLFSLLHGPTVPAAAESPTHGSYASKSGGVIRVRGRRKQQTTAEVSDGETVGEGVADETVATPTSAGAGRAVGGVASGYESGDDDSDNDEEEACDAIYYYFNPFCVDIAFASSSKVLKLQFASSEDACCFFCLIGEIFGTVPEEKKDR